MREPKGPLGIGLVGCGVIGQVHSAILAQLEADGTAIRPVAAADPSAKMREQAQRNWPFLRVSADATDVVADSEVDALIVASPTAAHAETVIAATEARKHLYCEKPLAPDFHTVVELCERVSSSGVIAQVGFQSRFHPLVRRLKGLIDSEELGTSMSYSLRDDQYFPTTAIEPGVSDWRSRITTSGGGALLEHSIHSLDLLTWLFGLPGRVFALTRNVFGEEVEDTAALVIEHRSGVVGTLTTVFHGVRGREERRLEAFFAGGVVMLTTDFLVGVPEETFFVQQAGSEAEIVDASRVEERLVDYGQEGRSFPFLQYLSVRAFIDAARAGRWARPDFADGLLAHATVEAAYRSASCGEPVKIVPDVLPGLDHPG